MSSQAAKRVFVVLGVGNGLGTGGATARLFAKNGYEVALIARGGNTLESLAKEINSNGGQAKSFPVSSYSHEDVTNAWSSIHKAFPKPEYAIRAAVFNGGAGVFKKFLDITPEDVQTSLQASVASAFSFSRGAILAFKDNDIDESNGARGSLIFTGATASIRGNILTSSFAAGKHGLRALSQSLGKEFGQENIHVAHAIIDGGILTDRSREYKNDPSWETNANIHLKPESIAASYLYLVNQDRSAWTWELDLRPAHEKW
ncbi:short-chain dehydrogenase/reductase SDR [Crepidotus variabilis]|uniref:Short-chain dehydrogenase/reductase SDR n=1 Tax=Crepidotus variabilis TaxID=179855 RepID=A0A9P6EKR6_9AGAR|nr:short-chain dehydrogenase/reductase SDR [Crepidotus variabilis]